MSANLTTKYIQVQGVEQTFKTASGKEGSSFGRSPRRSASRPGRPERRATETSSRRIGARSPPSTAVRVSFG